MKNYKLFVGVISIICIAVGSTYAQQVTKPHTFVSGTPAQAGEVNENFDVLYQKINELADQLSQLSQNVDLDGDGYSQILDCDDNNSSIYPGAEEICGNGVDDDCDQVIDDGCTPSCTPGDPCGNTLGECITQYDADCNCVPVQGPTPEVCDGLDNDCDGTTDEALTNILCPSAPNVDTYSCFAGECAIGGCVSNYYDVDGDYQTGCECSEDLYRNRACAASYILGTIDVVGETRIINGIIIPENVGADHSADWYRFSITGFLGNCYSGYEPPNCLTQIPVATFNGPNADNFSATILIGSCSGTSCDAQSCEPRVAELWSDVLLVEVRLKDGINVSSCEELHYEVEVSFAPFSPQVDCTNLNPGANLGGCDFSGQNLSGLDLNGALLGNANMSNALLNNTNLSSAKMSYTILSGTDLTNTIITGADLSYADLSGANLNGLDLTTLTMHNARFTDAILSNTDMSNLDLHNTGLSRAVLTDANLQNAWLTSATLEDAILRGADLRGVNFDYANLRGVDACGAIVDDALWYAEANYFIPLICPDCVTTMTFYDPDNPECP